MAQKEVYEILKELGGQATQKQIRDRAVEKYPTYSLHLYIGNRLRKLEKNGYLKSKKTGKDTLWVIIDEYP